MSLSLFPFLAYSLCSTPLDALALHVGLGVSKPFASQSISSTLPGASIERRIATLPTLLTDLDATLQHQRWEGGLALGIEGEILSVHRIESTGFSTAHLDLVGALRLWEHRASQLKIKAMGGWAIPVLRHDEAEIQDASGGPHGAFSLILERSALQIELGTSISSLKFTDQNQMSTNTSRWTQHHAFLKMNWNWLARP